MSIATAGWPIQVNILTAVLVILKYLKGKFKKILILWNYILKSGSFP